MSNRDLLNKKLLVALSCSEETAGIIMERINDAETTIGVLKKEVEALTQQRDALAEWKRHQLEVERWWQKIDEHIRQLPPDVGILGYSVSDIALRLLDERHQFSGLLREMKSRIEELGI